MPIALAAVLLGGWRAALWAQSGPTAPVIAPGPEVPGAVARGAGDLAAAQKLARAKRYAEAVTERGLRRTYESIGSHLASRTQFRQITMWFVGVAMAFAFAAAAGSLFWTSRLP